MKNKLFAMVCTGAASALLLTACYSAKEMNEAAKSKTEPEVISEFIGKTAVRNKTTRNEVFIAIGAPGLVFKDEEKKTETWVYNRVAVRTTDFQGDVAGDFAFYFPYEIGTRSKGGGVVNVGAKGAARSASTTYKTAALLITFNERGLLDSYEFTATNF